ncbi:unnamed protein product [Lasius platythorax]|uniref:Uncharacterized protein n=1 Tax=Lasius platythorax TaxID=488582 RepID=A0AAV2NXF7_9HYME
MDYKQQLEKLREEKNILLRRIDQKIRMQGILKKRQEKVNMLRRLAGEEEGDASPTPMEVEKMSKKESDRSTEVSRKMFLALQAVNTEGTFCKKTTIMDNDNKSACDVNVIVSVKRTRQSEGVAKLIKINLTIEGNAMSGEISYTENKDDIIPCSLEKMIDRFKQKSTTENKKNQPRSAKPRIVSDLKVSLSRIKVDNKKTYSRRSVSVEKQKETKTVEDSATKTKTSQEEVEKEIARLEDMLARAQRKRSSLTDEKKAATTTTRTTTAT